jgi:hypothetical protein
VTFGRYVRAVLGAVVVTQALALPFVPAAARAAVALGALLAALNVLAAYVLAAWGSRRSVKAFMTAVLGGMAARTLLLLSLVALGIVVLELPALPLVLSLIANFVPLLAFELSVLHRGLPAAAVAR